MSNLNLNPIEVTGSVTGYKAQTQAAQGTLRSLEIQRIRWVNPGVSASLSIGDPVSGTILELMKSNSSGEDVEIDYVPTRLWSDFAVDIFPNSGTLLIFTR
jgi:hypothetical protein